MYSRIFEKSKKSKKAKKSKLQAKLKISNPAPMAAYQPNKDSAVNSLPPILKSSRDSITHLSRYLTPHERAQSKKACRQLNHAIQLTPQLLLNEYSPNVDDPETMQKILSIMKSNSASKELAALEDKLSTDRYRQDIGGVKVFGSVDTYIARRCIYAGVALPFLLASFLITIKSAQVTYMPTEGVDLNNGMLNLLLGVLVDLPASFFQASFVSLTSFGGLLVLGHKVCKLVDKHLLINPHPELKNAHARLDKEKDLFRMFKKIASANATNESKQINRNLDHKHK